MRSPRGRPSPASEIPSALIHSETEVTPTSPLEEGQLALVLDEKGVILSCSDNCETVVGYRREELESRHISRLVLQFLALPLFVNGQLNPLVSFLGHCDIPFLVRHRRGNTISSRVSFVHLHHLDHPAIRVLISPPQPGRVPQGPAWSAGT